jgi:uncharacterized protein
MNCPTCNVPLIITERSGIEIDYCQKCRGVWLDRGELDKLIEKAGSQKPSMAQGAPRHDDEDTDDARSTPHNAHRRERENPLMDIFDFF